VIINKTIVKEAVIILVCVALAHVNVKPYHSLKDFLFRGPFIIYYGVSFIIRFILSRINILKKEG